MTTEGPDPDPHLDAWLDGLAGRPAPGAEPQAAAAHRQGQRLRGALVDLPAAAAPTSPAGSATVQTDAAWQLLLERARPAAAAANEAGLPGLESVDAKPASEPARAGRSASTTPWAGRTWAAAASVAAALVLINGLGGHDGEAPPAQLPTGDTAWRGDAAHTEAGPALWRSAQPAQDAARLAAALQAAGAQVAVQPQGAGQLLRVNAPAQARAATNAVLAPLETALGADGQLQLLLLPAAAASDRP